MSLLQRCFAAEAVFTSFDYACEGLCILRVLSTYPQCAAAKLAGMAKAHDKQLSESKCDHQQQNKKC
eukprot:6258699-Amphidinium_carterae.1